MFLKVGTPSWDLKIDLKELEDKKKTTWKKTRTKEAAKRASRSSQGGVGATFLETLFIFEASQGAMTPIEFP